jgi:ribosomal protein L40E
MGETSLLEMLTFWKLSLDADADLVEIQVCLRCYPAGSAHCRKCQACLKYRNNVRLPTGDVDILEV